MPAALKAILILVVILAVLVGLLWYLRKRVLIVGEFVQFLIEQKLWWMTPIVIVFVLLGVFIALTQSSAVAPFIYALF